MTESKRRKRKFDQDITPTPAKIAKMNSRDLSLFEDVTPAVMEYRMYPFLGNQDLAQLSQVTKLQRNLTENKLATKKREQDQEKDRIKRVIIETTERNAWDEKSIKQLINDIWKLPYDSNTWNRLELFDAATQNIPLHISILRRVDEHLALKLTAKDFAFPDKKPGPRYVAWVIQAKNITAKDKLSILEKLFVLFDNFDYIDYWHAIISWTNNLPDQKLLLPFAEKYLKLLNDEYKEELQEGTEREQDDIVALERFVKWLPYEEWPEIDSEDEQDNDAGIH